MAEVELIASGYAWRCPECRRTEYESAVPTGGRVRCEHCGACFAITRIEHRIEPGLLDAHTPPAGREEAAIAHGEA